MHSFYNNLSDKQLGVLCRKLLPIENAVSETLKSQGYGKSMRVASDYPLNWSYTTKDGRFESNIGIDYIDEPGEPRFRVYAAKYLDKYDRTLGTKEYLNMGIVVEDLIQHALEYMTHAASRCSQWGEKDLEEFR